MIQLKGLGHVVLRVADIERSKRFYTELLGFTVLEQDPNHGGVFLSLGNASHCLDLQPSSDPAAGPWPSKWRSRAGLGLGHVAFTVADRAALEAAYFTLVDHGVEIVAALDHTSQQSVYFRDPDGHILECYWERPDAVEIFRRGRADEDTPITFARETVPAG
ncbi:MAG: VOC family protein [Proteobacteria bacterium]|nr:VOC family protein [Pseudomonadota bacterium]